jgi:hypothetical protein
MDLRITMLDGGLGAVADPSTALSPAADALCWCDCVICVQSPSIEAMADLV